jgi:hypothetical protein
MAVLRFTLQMLISLGGALLAQAQVGSRVLIQPVMEYQIRDPALVPQQSSDGTRKINPFIAYTHIGTDFGFHGPGERFMSWEHGRVCVGLIGQAEWAGMWHSLAGLAASPNETMNFSRYYPTWIVDEFQPEVTAVRFKATGSGSLKLEIKTSKDELVWTHVASIEDPVPRYLTVPVPSDRLPDAKFLTWTAEPGSGLCLLALQLAVQIPAMDFDQYVLLASYAKLAHCYCPATGLVRDRAHVCPGSFDSISATGYFALATAVLAHPDVGMINPEEGRKLVHHIHEAVTAVPRAMGLLPHFTKEVNGKNVIHPGTEYSTVDTAIYSFAMLLAAEIIQDAQLVADVLKEVSKIDFKKLRIKEARISHGLRDDGKTVIPFSWGDWGGETALVMLLERLSGSTQSAPSMEHNGKVWQGTGFITEIQSLFFPDFDSNEPDAVSAVSWYKARREMLCAQKNYFPYFAPDSRATKLNLYGLSAGEGAFGTTYEVNGVDLKNEPVIHPHYILMSACLEEKPSSVYNLLTRMDREGYFNTRGMVENISAKENRYLPMIGALNAGFETLGAYHLMVKNRKQTDVIYAASMRNAEIRSAMRLFYPKAVTVADKP